MSYREPASEKKFQNQQVHAKDVFDLHHYKPLKKYLMSLGLNPYNENRESKIRQNVVMYTLVFGIIPLFLQLCVVIRGLDLDAVIDELPHLLLVVGSLVKLENILLNKKRMKMLLDIVVNDWTGWKNELPILENSTAQGSELARLYRSTLCNRQERTMETDAPCTFFTASLIGASLCFIYIPLINPTLDLIMPLNETRPKQQLFGVCYVFIDAEDHFIAVFLHSGWITFVTVYNIAVIDSLFILIIHHVCGLFDVCGYQIQMASQNPELQYDQFRECVMTHHKALIFFHNLQEYSQNVFLVLVSMNMIGISTTAVQILLHMDHPLDTTRFVLFFLCLHFHLYIVSLFGEMILNHSTIVAESIYNSNWYEIPIKFQKLLCMMIVRCNKPCILSAGGLYDMNMENYGKAVKTCMSYFTMFLSMRE